MDAIIHPKFGKGSIISITTNAVSPANKYITIQFGTQTKTFIYPTSILNNTFSYVPEKIINQAQNDLLIVNKEQYNIDNIKIHQNKINFIKQYLYIKDIVMEHNNILTRTQLRHIIDDTRYLKYDIPENIDVDAFVYNLLTKKIKYKQHINITNLYYGLNNTTPLSAMLTSIEINKTNKHQNLDPHTKLLPQWRVTTCKSIHYTSLVSIFIKLCNVVVPQPNYQY